MREGDISRLPRLDRKRDADEFRARSVEARGLGIDSDAPGLGRAGDPPGEGVKRAYKRVVALLRRRRRAGGRGFRSLSGPAVFGADARQKRAEFVFGEEGAQRFAFGRQRAEVLQRHGNRRIVAQGHESAAHAREIGMVDEVLSTPGLFDFPGVGEQRIEVAPVVDERRGGLDADPRHAGDVIGRVAGEGLHVDDLFRGNAEFPDHLGGADFAHTDGVEHDDAIADQLHEVLVAGGDGHAVAAGGGEAGIGGDQVVGLETGEFDGRQSEGPRGVAHQRELRHEGFRRFRAVGLVVGVDVVAEGDTGGIEQDGDAVPFPGAGEFVDHVAEAEHGVGRRPVRAVEGRQRVKGAEDEPRAVDQTDAPFAPFRIAHRPAPASRRREP